MKAKNKALLTKGLAIMIVAALVFSGTFMMFSAKRARAGALMMTSFFLFHEGYTYAGGADFTGIASGPQDYAQVKFFLLNKADTANPQVPIPNDLEDAFADTWPTAEPGGAGWDVGSPMTGSILAGDTIACVFEVINGVNGYTGPNYTSASNHVVLAQDVLDSGCWCDSTWIHSYPGLTDTYVSGNTIPVSFTSINENQVAIYDSQWSVVDSYSEPGMILGYNVYSNGGAAGPLVYEQFVPHTGDGAAHNFNVDCSARGVGDWIDIEIGVRYKGENYPSTSMNTTGRSYKISVQKSVPPAAVEFAANWNGISLIGDEDGNPATATSITASAWAASIEAGAGIDVYQISKWTSSGWVTYARRDGTSGAMIGASGIGDFTLDNGEAYMIRTDGAGSWNFAWTTYTVQPDWSIDGGWNAINCARCSEATSTALLGTYVYLDSIATWTAAGWDTDEGASAFNLVDHQSGSYTQDKNANGIFVRSTDYSGTNNVIGSTHNYT